MYGAAGARHCTDNLLVNGHSNLEGRPGLTKAALFGLCPRCDAQSIYNGGISSLRFAEKCSGCSLDYTGFNVGDGPAALLIIPISTLVIILAILLEAAAHPPFWLHALIWIPLTTILTFASIRITKAALLILEFRRGAGEFRQMDEADK